MNRRSFLGLAGVLGLDPGSRTFGRADVELLHADFDRLRDLDSRLGGADTFRLYAAELARTETILTKGHYSEQVKTSLIKLLAEQSQQAGWAAFDGGAERTALALFEHSRLAAEKASADDLAANALILTAYVAPNDPESDALKRSETYRVTPAVKPLLDSRRALSYAARGDAHNAYLRLERAYKGLDAGVDGAPHWAGWIDERELAIVHGRVHASLKRHDRAIETLTKALARYPDEWGRDKSLYTLILADALAGAGNSDAAAAAVRSALSLASPIASTRPTALALQVSERLPAERDLQVRLRTIKPARLRLP